MTDASLAVQEYLLSLLSGDPALSELADAGQIRAASDQSDPPVGAAAVVVACNDLGSHLALPGRVLVDVHASVEVRSSLTADPSMARFNAFSSAVFGILSAIQNDTLIRGWDIRYGCDWSEGEVQQDGFYRYQEFSATILLQVSPTNSH